MSQGLSLYARKLMFGEDKLMKQLTSPVLIWEAPTPADTVNGMLEVTEVKSHMARPTSREPVVYEIKKNEGLGNPFAMGITIGRSDKNDIHIDDASLSRFHAYIQVDSKQGSYRLFDADSTNGTRVGPLKLEHGKSAVLRDDMTVRLGDIELRFMSPSWFCTWLRRRVDVA